MQNKLIKNAGKKELRASAVCAIVMILISDIASAVIIYPWAFLSVRFPILGTPIIAKLFEIAAYIAQLSLPAVFYLILNKKRLRDVCTVIPHGEQCAEREKISPAGILSYFVLAFSLSQITASFSSVISELVSYLGSLISENLILNQQAFETAAAASLPELALDFVAIAILPAILEELLFRGIFLNEFLKYGKTFAICISAFFFASVHGSTEQMAYSFVYGIIFGYIAVKTGSLKTGIIIHFMNNAYSCIFEYLAGIYDTDLFQNVILTLNLLLVAIGLATAIYKIIKNRFGFSEKKDSEKQPFELTEKEKYSVFLSPAMLLYYAYIIAETLYVYISYNLTV